jgi:hypothetical protein
MRTAQDLINDLRAVQRAVAEALPGIATAVALSAKALAERNVKEKGVGEYSENPIPLWFLEDKELNGAGTAYIEAQKSTKVKKKINPAIPVGFGNWGDFRVAQGLQDDHVDLTYSGFMWGNMQPGDPQQLREYAFAAFLGGTNKEAQDKMNWNAARYGDFVTKSLTDDNRETLTLVVADMVVEIQNKILLHE